MTATIPNVASSSVSPTAHDPLLAHRTTRDQKPSPADETALSGPVPSGSGLTPDIRRSTGTDSPPVQTLTPESDSIAKLNARLRDAGLAYQFRLHKQAGGDRIQEINRTTGDIIAEYPADEFAALARSLGIDSALLNEHA